MKKEIKTVFNFFNKEIPELAQALVKLSEFVKEENPDIILIPLRGALPIKTMLHYIYYKKGFELPKFSYIHLSSREGVTKKAIETLKRRNGEFKKVMFLDEVITGNCWYIVFSPLEDDFFKHLKKHFKTNKLILSGIAQTGMGLKQTRKNILMSTVPSIFKIYREYECEIVKKIIQIIKNEKNTQLSSELISLEEITRKIHSIKDYEKNLSKIIILLIKFLIKNRIDVEYEFINKNLLIDSKVINNVKQSINELSNTKIKKQDNDLEKKVKNLIKNKPSLFKVRKGESKLEIKLFEIPGITFSDEPKLLGIGRDLEEGSKGRGDITKLRYFKLPDQETPKQFYLILTLAVDKALGILNKKEWINKIEESEDEEFKKSMKKVIKKL